MTMIIAGDDLQKFIPQKEPMVMIDRLIAAHENTFETGLLIKEDNIFCSSNRFTEPGLIENIAQSSAIGIGYNLRKEAKDPPLAYIGAVRDLKIFELPEVNTEIKTLVTVDNEVLGFIIVSGRTYSGDRLITRCEMRFFIQQIRE